MSPEGVPTPEVRRVEARGGPVEAWHASGAGPAVVLIHGAAGHRDLWGSLWSRFEPMPRVAVSLPGRPGSDGEPAQTAAEAASWLVEVLGKLEVSAPILVGHSYGGAVALEAALAGMKLSGLVLTATGAKLRVASSLLEAAEKATEPMPMDAAFGSDASAEVKETYGQASSTTPPASALADWRACNGFDVRARLSELKVPTLIVHGDEDVLTPTKFQLYLEQSIAGAVRVELSGSGHMVPWESPQRFADVLREFQAR